MNLDNEYRLPYDYYNVNAVILVNPYTQVRYLQLVNQVDYKKYFLTT